MSRGENKLKAFFRSRSRSRQQHDPLAEPDVRPVSSITTATHSTITPLPSDSTFRRGRHPYSRTADPADDLDDHRFPRSETPPKHKFLLHTIFGVSLSRRSSQQSSVRIPSTSSEPASKSARKRSFRLTSRPATLDECTSKSPYSIPVPSNPLPLSASPRRRSFGFGSSHRSTPKSSASHLPLPHAQSPKSTRSHARRHSLGSERPPHDSAVALSEEPSLRIAYKPARPLPDATARTKGKEREKRFPDSDAPLPDFPPPIDLPSNSLPADPLISHTYPSSHFARHPVFSHLPTVDSASSDENDQVPRHLSVIPRIIHTPPTPQRPGADVDSSSASTPLPHSARVDVPKPPNITYREQLLASSTQPHTDRQNTISSKGRFAPRIFGGKDSLKTKDTNGLKSARHPPASSDGSSPQKTPTSGPARNMTSHRSKLGSFDFERPVSTLNRSNSTIDRQGAHFPRDKTHLHSLGHSLSQDSARGAKSAHHPGHAESQIKPFHTGDTSVVSFSSVSVQTLSTGKGIGNNTPVDQSSSRSRASGRRILHTSHGDFAFEHSSSLPSSPNPRNLNLPIGPNQNEGNRSQHTTPLHTIFDARVKHPRGPLDHVEPGHSRPSERKSKGKGRSLDLGLGLSWAPTRVREEVLMPGLILARENGKLEKSKANGSDVTKMFEGILSESRFQTFKEDVHRFDAHLIPLEGPSGLLARVESLLAESGLNQRERNKLMSDFTVFVENHGG